MVYIIVIEPWLSSNYLDSALLLERVVSFALDKWSFSVFAQGWFSIERIELIKQAVYAICIIVYARANELYQDAFRIARNTSWKSAFQSSSLCDTIVIACQW